ncbi:hypothetical protein TURU_109754 [Turdus rufiventris]|nr:hypothetical protein TURU_109754 [Turdus rufiventris]
MCRSALRLLRAAASPICSEPRAFCATASHNCSVPWRALTTPCHGTLHLLRATGSPSCFMQRQALTAPSRSEPLPLRAQPQQPVPWEEDGHLTNRDMDKGKVFKVFFMSITNTDDRPRDPSWKTMTTSERSWESVEILADWKLRNVVTVVKKREKEDPRNYRPASLPSVPVEFLILSKDPSAENVQNGTGNDILESSAVERDLDLMACNEPKPDESINIQVNIDSDGNGKGNGCGQILTIAGYGMVLSFISASLPFMVPVQSGESVMNITEHLVRLTALYLLNIGEFFHTQVNLILMYQSKFKETGSSSFSYKEAGQTLFLSLSPKPKETDIAVGRVQKYVGLLYFVVEIKRKQDELYDKMSES